LSFGTLTVIVLAGLGGPLLALSEQRFVPIVVGEIIAGILVGPEALSIVDPANTTISFLGQVGFAMLMLTVGMHLPLRDPRLARSLRSGTLLAAIVAVLAIPAGLLAAAVAGTAHASVYAVLLASGSAAVLLPALEEADATGLDALAVMAQVTIADIVTILSVPIVLQPGRTATARLLRGRAWVGHVRHLSKQRHWALDLRLSLLVLFLLAWVAQKSGTSVLVAGFGAGLMVALIGGPKRLSTQVRGVADGFFIPLYFVVLGIQLDLHGLFGHPEMLELAAALALLNIVIHLAAVLLTRRPLSAGLAASAQLGVPAAVASLGLAEHVLSGTVATAIVAAAVVSLGVCTIGVERMLAHESHLTPAGTGLQAPA
jgi:Kef-type K+ transport system membrane component KefB